jgi:hypothetical protein
VRKKMQPHQLRKVQQLQLQAAVAEAAVAEAAVAEAAVAEAAVAEAAVAEAAVAEAAVAEAAVAGAKKDKIVFFFISVLFELRELGQRARRVGIWILTTLVPNILK